MSAFEQQVCLDRERRSLRSLLDQATLMRERVLETGAAELEDMKRRLLREAEETKYMEIECEWLGVEVLHVSRGSERVGVSLKRTWV